MHHVYSTAFLSQPASALGQCIPAGMVAPSVLADQSWLNHPSHKLNAAARQSPKLWDCGRFTSGISVFPKTTLCGRCPRKSDPGTLALLSGATPPSAWGGATGLPPRGHFHLEAAPRGEGELL